MSGNAVAAAKAAAFRGLSPPQAGIPAAGIAPADPGFADKQRDCFVGVSLTAKPSYTWRVA